MTLETDVSKYYADSHGNQTAAELQLPLDIGVFARSPADPAFSSADVLLLDKRLIASGSSSVTLHVDQVPVYVGIDPYHKLIDRETDDNLVAVRFPD